MTRAALLLVAPALLAATAAAAPVVYCEQRQGACAGLTQPLGSTEKGRWGVLDVRERPLPPVLYASRAAYDAATAGLSAAERAQTVEHRVARAREQPLSAVLDEAQAALRVAARGADGATLAAILAAAVELAGADRFRGSRPQAIVASSLDEIARILVEEPPAAAAYREEARAHRALLNQLEGTHHPLDLLPVVEKRPVYHVAPLPAQKVTMLQREHDHAIQPWMGGVVAPFSARELRALGGGRARPLYAGAELFAEDLALAPPQLDRALRARLRRTPVSDRQALLERLAFHHAVELRASASALARTPAADPWRRIIARDDEALRAVFAGAPPTDALSRARDTLATAAALAALLPGTRDADRLRRAAQALDAGAGSR